MRSITRVSLSALGVAVALAGFVPGESRGQQARQEIYPEAELQVAPCCHSTAQHTDPGWTPELRRETVAPPEEGPGDEAWRRALREAGAGLAPRARALEDGVGQLLPPAGAPKPGVKFGGLHFGQSGGLVPPDTQLAAGPEHLLEAVNSVIRMTDKRGRSPILQTANEHFGLDADVFVFDPKLHYDPLSGRFFLVYLELDRDRKQSFLLISVSRSGAPASLGDDDWCKYRVRSKVGPSWADYPGLGMNETWLAISTNNFAFKGGFKRAYFWVVDKSRVIDNAASCPEISVSRLRTRKDGDGKGIFNPQVAQHYEATGLPGAPLLAINTQFLGYSERYVLWRITTAGTRGGVAKPKASHELVPGGAYAYPPEATQKGSAKAVDAGDLRVMQQLVYRDGALWVVHTSGCVFGDGEETFSCVRAARVAVDADGAAVVFQDLFGVPDHFLFWPGIGVASNGDVIAAFHIAGRKRRLGTAFNGLPGGAARFGPLRALADEFDKVADLARGKCPTEMPTSQEQVRTGDYIGVSPDPDSNDMWIAGEYAKKVGGDCAWSTTVASVKY